MRLALCVGGILQNSVVEFMARVKREEGEWEEHTPGGCG